MCSNETFVEKFIIWLGNSNLSPNSVKTYVNSIICILKLKKIDHSHFNSYLSKILLRGLSQSTHAIERSRRVMTVDLLKVLGHEISLQKWVENSKRLFWTACCVLFFGSLRIGEILSESENSFDPNSCLLWNDVVFENDSVILHLKNTKTKVHGGEFIDLFKVNNVCFCPWTALKGLMKNSVQVKPNKPVFSFDSGKLLTPSLFNSTIRKLLSKHIGDHALGFSSHSFRAGIPSALAQHPCTTTVKEIKHWGRWHSGCFRLYTRLHINQRRAIHEKVCGLLNCRSASPTGGRGVGGLSL